MLSQIQPGRYVPYGYHSADDRPQSPPSVGVAPRGLQDVLAQRAPHTTSSPPAIASAALGTNCSEASSLWTYPCDEGILAPTGARVGYLPIATTAVGRVSELTALVANLEEARSKRGSVTVLSGVPGIGKSRLAFEVSGLAAGLGMSVLWGRCFEGEDARAFAPWVEALGGYLRELDGDRLQRHLGQHAAALAQILPNVRDALHDLPAAPSTTPGENRMRLFDAVVHAVLVAADERPVLLVLDDLHWADQASLALLRHLARHIADAAVLVLCTLREEELAANQPLDELITMLRREAPYQHITLPDLSLDESSALAALVLEQRQQNADSGDAGRRPGRDFAESNGRQSVLHPGNGQGPGRNRTDRPPTRPVGRRLGNCSWDVPREVRDVIDRRLRRLPASAQRLLHAACACTTGFTFAEAQR